MRIFSEKYRLLGWLSVVLLAGFLTTSIAGFVVSRDSVRRGISEQALPLTSDNIYSAIQTDILRPTFIATMMAHDTFMRDWIISGENDTGQIIHYLQEIKKKYGTTSSFLVSERTRKYYSAEGTLRSIQEGQPDDSWFFRFKNMTTPYVNDIASDVANRNTMTIFINHRVLDYDGNFIGVAGVGLTLDTMTHIIDSYQSRFKRNIYFIDQQGTIVLAGESMKQVRASIRDLPGINSIADRVLNHSSTPTRLDYQRDDTILVNSRFIPELGWYLLVEQNVTQDVKAVQQVFILNLAISAIVTLLVLAITLFAVNRYHKRIERMAGTDALTGLLNRQAFDIVFRQSMLEAGRTGRPLSGILFDVDFFKQVNDTHGHLAGDSVLSAVARLAKSVVRECDVIARWGGEEFLILLKECPLDQAIGVAEKLRKTIAGHDFALAASGPPLTVSLGVAQFEVQESPVNFFSRADQALYQAKANGRNRTEVAAEYETA